jgi:hypothetical protein
MPPSFPTSIGAKFDLLKQLLEKKSNRSLKRAELLLLYISGSLGGFDETTNRVVLESTQVTRFMMEGGAAETLVEALKVKGRRGDFYISTCAIVVLLLTLLMEVGGQEPTMRFLENNLIDAVIPVMKAWSENADILGSCMLMIGLAVVKATDEKRLEITNESTMLEDITIVFEEHGKSDAEVLRITCMVLDSCYCPGIELNESLFRRIVQCLCDGILVHQYYEDAQDVSRRMLCRFVGPEKAKEMIRPIELYHCENAECAAAA